MKVLKMVMEGKFGVGGLYIDMRVDDEDESIFAEDVREFDGTTVCGSDDDGVEYVVASDDVSWKEMWEEYKKYEMETYKEQFVKDEWFELMKKSIGQRTDLYIYKDFQKGGKYYKE